MEITFLEKRNVRFSTKDLDPMFSLTQKIYIGKNQYKTRYLQQCRILVETKKDMIFIFDKSSDLTDAFFSKSV
jgi:hypothetical protein